MDKLEFRSNHIQTHGELPELTRLLIDIFGLDILPLNRLGHDPSVTAFGWWCDDKLVANVSLYERKLWLAGEEVKAFGVQSVAVRPEWRGKGLFGDLMERAINYADARAALMTLETGTPSLYTPFGFRPSIDTAFSAKIVQRQQSGWYRTMSLDEDSDLAFLKDMFSRRTPTSFVASACDHPALFLLKAFYTPEIELLHLPELDAIVAINGRDEPVMTPHDIIAPSIPPLEEIISALGYTGERINVNLTPDRLAWIPEEQNAVDNGHMVRGLFPPEGTAFMLSDMYI